MARPILLAVDDDISVLEAVVQDLRRQYGETYRVMRAASGQAALDTLAQLKTREEPVALIISDQRMPGMTGVEFLERAREHLSRRAPRAPYRLRRHRSRHSRHQLPRASTTTSTSPGTRRKRSSTPSSPIFSRTGRQATGRLSRACASSASAGRSTTTRAQLPLAQSRALPLARCRREP